VNALAARLREVIRRIEALFREIEALEQSGNSLVQRQRSQRGQ